MNMGNPVRSEEAAFRYLVAIVGGAVAIVAVTALAGRTAGGVFAALLVGLGIGLVWRSARRRATSSTSG